MPITAAVARAQVHRMRAEADAILIGIGTRTGGDPELTCRLPGLEQRSPLRIVLDGQARLPVTSKLVKSFIRNASSPGGLPDADAARKAALEAAGATFIGAEDDDGRIALPELLDDLAQRGLGTLMVEGGSAIARSFSSRISSTGSCSSRARPSSGSVALPLP